MAVRRWDPFRELAAMEALVDDMMRRGAQVEQSGGAAWVPPAEAWETEDAIVIAFDVPGVSRDRINVEVDEGRLLISGERDRRNEQREEGSYRTERRYGSFSRSVVLPEGADPERISAECRDGVLEIRIPKPEERRPRRIQVGGEEGTIEGQAERVEVQHGPEGGHGEVGPGQAGASPPGETYVEGGREQQ